LHLFLFTTFIYSVWIILDTFRLIVYLFFIYFYKFICKIYSWIDYLFYTQQLIDEIRICLESGLLILTFCQF
jgi:hypothetical protein